MNFNEFAKHIERMAMKVKADKLSLVRKVEADARGFIDDNFRSQSWEGVGWEKSSENGTTLVKSGALKKSFNSERSPDQVRIYTNVKYARVHNEGFKGQVNVKAHKRAVYAKLGRGKKKKTGIGDVKAFSRYLDIEKRQFAPYAGHESPTLNATVKETITDHFLEIFKPK